MNDKTCPLGDGCDLSVAWMAGAEDARDKCRARIKAMEAERDALRAQVERLRAALTGLVDAMDAVDREAERADQPGATAWSSAPVVALRYKRQEARAALGDSKP